MILQNVVPWGRNLDEYRDMFALSERDVKGRILGCGDGPSSFNAEATALGSSVTSIDPVYAFSAVELLGRINETAETVMEQVSLNQEAFVWSSIASLQQLEQIRMGAMHCFLEDYETGKEAGRYVEGALPKLPFKSAEFDLVLCSHFLFLYSEHFDLDFHTASVGEMCRVGGEVRIFPLVDLKGKPSPYLAPLMCQLEENGMKCSVEQVGYEFQKGGNEMLRIRI